MFIHADGQRCDVYGRGKHHQIEHEPSPLADSLKTMPLEYDLTKEVRQTTEFDKVDGLYRELLVAREQGFKETLALRAEVQRLMTSLQEAGKMLLETSAEVDRLRALSERLVACLKRLEHHSDEWGHRCLTCQGPRDWDNHADADDGVIIKHAADCELALLIGAPRMES